jgi:hypothetical protein
MFNGSHSRSSHPFDKRVPKMEKTKREVTEEGYVYYSGYDSQQRQLIKKMHKKKQRQHDTNLEKNNGEW